MNKTEVIVIGAGLAGCEAAMVLSRLGIRVLLVEMKPIRFSPAHKSETYGELVCSNSLKTDRENTAAGMLKRELRMLGSIVMDSADQTKLPAGNALAVDRKLFSEKMTATIESEENIRVIHCEATEIPEDRHVIVATGPLTDGMLAEQIHKLVGDSLFFFDAASPIVSSESIRYEHAFLQGRFGQDDDYLNCPLTKEEYKAFFEAITTAELAPQHEFDARFFESCMPIEAIAARGFKTPLFGPMSPKGIKDPVSGQRPFAVVQLRRENNEATMWNLVGFQTNLKFGEQKRVFGLIPALRDAEYLRYGVMHRNTYLPAGTLDATLSVRKRPSVRFAGQITGVEGYIESAAMGLCAGLFTAAEVLGKKTPVFSKETALGALLNYVGCYEGKDFQPMNMNFGLLPPIEEAPSRNKQLRHVMLTEREKAVFEAALAHSGLRLEGGRLIWN